MSRNFDEILKKGKEKVVSGKTKNKKELFKEHVVGLISTIHKLNDLYDNGQHNIMISNANCSKCNKPTFVLTVKNIENSQQTIKFYKFNWKVAGQGTFNCEKCKKV